MMPWKQKNGRCKLECNTKGQNLAAELKRPITAGSDSHFYGIIDVPKLCTNAVYTSEWMCAYCDSILIVDSIRH